MIRIILALLLLCGSAYGQAVDSISGVGAVKPNPAAAGGGRTCTDGTASANFLARVSGASNNLKDYYCEMINGLVADGVITGNLSGATGCGSNLDGLYIFWTNTTTTANLNLCGTSYGLAQQGAVAFTANSNYTPDGTTGYFKTGYTFGGVTALNSASLGAYILNSRTAGSTTAWGGRTDTGGTDFSYLGYTTLLIFELNAMTFPSIASPNAQGLNIVTRTSMTNINAYRNGSSLGSTSDSSFSLANLEMYAVGAYNLNGTPTAFSSDNIGAFFFGANVDSFVASLSNRINCMAFRQGVNVYASTC